MCDLIRQTHSRFVSDENLADVFITWWDKKGVLILDFWADVREDLPETGHGYGYGESWHILTKEDSSRVRVHLYSQGKFMIERAD